MTDKHADHIQSVGRLIDDYIYTHWLDNGTPLPEPQQLAEQLSCPEESVVEALQAAQAAHAVSCTNGAWSVLVPQHNHGQSFSFTTSAYGRSVTTEVIETAIRLPTADKDHPLYPVEQRVSDALRISKVLPFIVIRRLRLINRHPGAFQHAYLNPTQFPPDFLDRHDFKNQSLINIYDTYGHKLLRRDTRLAPRLATGYEVNTLRAYAPSLETRFVLDAEQRLWATKAHDQAPVVLEFLKAAYLDNWRYEIKNRPASGLL